MGSPGGVLLVNTNREVRPDVVLPVGMLRVADACAAAEVLVSVVDLAFVSKPRTALLRAIEKHQPSVIGFSIRNIDNADYRARIFYLPFVKDLVQVARNATDATLVIGGAGVSIAPEATRAALGVDVAVAGPGEQALVDLWKRTRERQPHDPVVFGEAGTFSATARFPRWIDLKPYRRRGAALPVQSRRGCPFHCVYCNYASIEGTERYDLLEPAEVVESTKRGLAETGFRSVEFVDSTFNSPPPYTRSLCRAFAAADLGVGLRASGITPRFADRETLEAMSEAGFEAIMTSPDTAAPATIESYGKDFEIDQLTAMAADTAELGMPVMWSFMFGGPGETTETVDQTVAFIEEHIHPDHPVMLTARMRIYPGTRLAGVADAQERPVPVLDPNVPGQFYLSDGVDEQWLDDRMLEVQGRCPNVMFMDGGQAASLPWIQRVRTLFRLRGPAWADYAATRRRLKSLGLD